MTKRKADLRGEDTVGEELPLPDTKRIRTSTEGNPFPGKANCFICWERKEIHGQTLTARCKNAPRSCYARISRRIRTQVVEMKQTEIACIEECDEILEYEEMNPFAKVLSSNSTMLSCLKTIATGPENLCMYTSGLR